MEESGREEERVRGMEELDKNEYGNQVEARRNNITREGPKGRNKEGRIETER